MNNRFFPALTLLLAVGLISAVVSLVIVRANRVPDLADTQQFDAWLHKQLGITAEQEAAMAEDEETFHGRQRQLIAEVQQLNGELAQAIVEEKAETERVREIIAKIHVAQGELQNATISHVFDMQRHLTPEQYERLLTLTADALRPANRSTAQH